MTESPRPTEEELEQGPDRINDEEDMRGPNESDPGLADREDQDDS